MRSNRGWKGLPSYSKEMFKERYFDKREDYAKWLDRVAGSYADDREHAERIKMYIKNYWFMPSTPVSSNAGLPDKGLPISCYTNEVEDSKAGIFSTWEENNWLGSYGGGIGTTWSNVRGIGERIGANGKSSGIIPFIKVSDSTTLAVSQGGLRRASQAVYLDVSHPEISEFIDIRRPTGDGERRSPNIHHGVTLSDAFMYAVEDRAEWHLVSPKTKEIVATVDAFDLFKKMLVSRVETGEPYMFFKDNANNQAPDDYKTAGRVIKTSNLCSEIMLHTDKDTSGVCCLTSMNLEYYDEWRLDEKFLEDIHSYTDNILSEFIRLTKDKEGFQKARKGAKEERSIGLGVMGYHSYLQSNNLPVRSLSTSYVTKKMFKYIGDKLYQSNIHLAIKKGKAPTSAKLRNVNVTSIAPTASISTLCNLTSPGIDTRVSNIYTAKTNIGSHTIKNKYLDSLLIAHIDKEVKGNSIWKANWIEDQWKSINKEGGSVQHLDWMRQDDKEVFKTAFEVNPHAVINNVSLMQPHITQGISTNLFLPADIDVQILYNVHMSAWKKGLKSLYYVRSKAISRASVGNQERVELEQDTCLSCA